MRHQRVLRRELAGTTHEVGTRVFFNFFLLVPTSWLILGLGKEAKTTTSSEQDMAREAEELFMTNASADAARIKTAPPSRRARAPIAIVVVALPSPLGRRHTRGEGAYSHMLACVKGQGFCLLAMMYNSSHVLKFCMLSFDVQRG